MKDSEDYVFSISGFDPCNYYDFDNETITIKYNLSCGEAPKSGLGF
jgi:hypothetical protein